MIGILIIYFLLAYLIGCIMTGYWVIKLLGKQDIRTQGSKSVGARNAGRIQGKIAFILTFLGDALKGIIVIVIARYLGFSEEMQLGGLFLAILGHIKPVTLQFKGGKGISTFIGGIIAFEPFVTVTIIIGFLLIYLFIKSFTLAGLGAFLLIPPTLLYLDYSIFSILLSIAIIFLLYWAHLENIMERLK